MEPDSLSKVQLTRRMAELSKGLSKELDGIADRAFEVAKHAKALEEQQAQLRADAGVQCNMAAPEPLYYLDRTQRLQPFEFQPLTKRQLDPKAWQKIRAINIDKLVGENDARLLMNFYGEIANADLEADSGYNLTQANLIKLCQVCQLMMQWQQWNTEQCQHALHVLTDEHSALQASLNLVPSNFGLTDVDQGLTGLGKRFARVADTDLDELMQKARAEERAARQGQPSSAAPPPPPPPPHQGTDTSFVGTPGSSTPAPALHSSSSAGQLIQAQSIQAPHQQQQQRSYDGGASSSLPGSAIGMQQQQQQQQQHVLAPGSQQPQQTPWPSPSHHNQHQHHQQQQFAPSQPFPPLPPQYTQAGQQIMLQPQQHQFAPPSQPLAPHQLGSIPHSPAPPPAMQHPSASSSQQPAYPGAPAYPPAPPRQYEPATITGSQPHMLYPAAPPAPTTSTSTTAFAPLSSHHPPVSAGLRTSPPFTQQPYAQQPTLPQAGAAAVPGSIARPGGSTHSTYTLSHSHQGQQAMPSSSMGMGPYGGPATPLQVQQPQHQPPPAPHHAPLLPLHSPLMPLGQGTGPLTRRSQAGSTLQHPHQ